MELATRSPTEYCILQQYYRKTDTSIRATAMRVLLCVPVLVLAKKERKQAALQI